MVDEPQPPQPGTSRFGGLSNRAVVAIVIAVLVIVFIVSNTRHTTVSFIGFSARTALWQALAVAAAGGFVAGFLVDRRRHKD